MTFRENRLTGHMCDESKLYDELTCPECQVVEADIVKAASDYAESYDKGTGIMQARGYLILAVRRMEQLANRGTP